MYVSINLNFIVSIKANQENVTRTKYLHMKSMGDMVLTRNILFLRIAH